ncbi:MAG: hypothetical protein QNJ09_18260 [Paracoccaceae bacterium]|nr:hypothetical protein [Paracoccaceae bacterium]
MPARRLVLHLGHAKTGSTAIQRALRASDQALARAGVLFPDPERHDNHQLIFPHLTGELPEDPVQMEALGGDAQAARDNAARLWDLLMYRIADEAPDTVVISSENHFRPFGEEALATLRARCAEIAAETEVIAYLRSPASFFLSNAQQDVKKRPEFRYLSPSRFRDTLEPLLEAGPGPVTAVRFARDVLAGGDAVSDFFACCLPEVEVDGIKRGAAEENTTVSAEAMALLQEVFRGTRDLPSGYDSNRKALRKILVACDAAVPGQTRPRLHDHVRALAEARCTDLEWLAETFDIRFPDVSQHDLSPEEAEAQYVQLRDIADLCPIDPERQDALWEAVAHSARAARNPARKLARRLGL